MAKKKYLDLRRDNKEAHQFWSHDFPHVYTAETGGQCRKQARREGWKLGERDLCPKCRDEQEGK